VAIDFTTDRWVMPSTANNRIAQQFLVAAEVTPLGQPLRVIKGRTRSASGITMGSQFQISDSAIQSDQFRASVGGDPTTFAPTYYCVTWERVFNPLSDTDIFARIVRTDSTLVGTSTIVIDNSSNTLDEYPSISKSNGSSVPGLTQDWTIVWQRSAGPGNHDIRGAQVDWSGTVYVPSFSIDSSANDDTLPSVSTLVDPGFPSHSYLVTYLRDLCPGCKGFSSTVMGAFMNESTMMTSADLLVLAYPPPADLALPIQPAVDSDGNDFTVTWVEPWPPFGQSLDYEARLANFTASPSGIVARGVGTYELGWWDSPYYFEWAGPKIVACHSGGATSPQYGVTWSYGAIWGAVFTPAVFVESCVAGPSGTGCPCHNQGSGGSGCNNSHNTGGARLNAAGMPSLQNDSVSIWQTGEWANTSSTLLQGTVNAPPVVFGDGIRCTGGVLKRLYTLPAASNGSVNFPPPSGPSISARSAALGYSIPAVSTVDYQVYYRDANLTFCSGGFNTGTDQSVLWVP
jgi:hypothetical protein